MSNVRGEISKDGNLLTLYVDLSPAAREAAPMSSSNKSRLIASTNGFTQFNDVKVSLNASISRREGDPAIIEKAKK